MNEYRIRYSFIIPHKNNLALLERCIESIPLRDDVEVIVIDDNSIDSQKPYVLRDNVKIIYIDKVESKGAGRARNIGLTNAIGEWVLFPDSDDYYLDGFMDILDASITNNIDVVYFNCIHCDGETGNILPKLSFNKDFEDYNGSYSTVDAIKYHHNAPWTKMIRHEYIKRYRTCFEEVVNGNDIFFSMRVGFLTNNIEVVKKPLYASLY